MGTEEYVLKYTKTKIGIAKRVSKELDVTESVALLLMMLVALDGIDYKLFKRDQPM